MRTTLDKLELGKKAKIISLNNSNIKRRLMDIGLIEDSIVFCYLVSPLKDPIAYKIKNAVIAIRKSDGKDIEVEVL